MVDVVSIAKRDWTVAINASNCVIQLILTMKNTTAGSVVQKHASVIILVNVFAIRIATIVWLKFLRLFPDAIISSECPVIRILPLFSVQSRVQRSCVVAIHVQINVENVVQENASKKFAKCGLRVIIRAKLNVILILQRLCARNLVTIY